ncbi:hypothetical protein [Fusobacterium sp. PH5-44]|uniref:hypothetical protein n=1 Tax=unclassified Fusobacterium TaxID=2648384 RepID=UPI003D242A80
MAVVFKMEKDGKLKDGLLGFSWTSFFFSFFVPLIRKDIPAFIGVFIVTVGGNAIIKKLAINSLENDSSGGGILFFSLLLFIVSVVWCFMYNKIYTTKLLTEGWMPVDSEGIRLIEEAGLGSYLKNMNNYESDDNDDNDCEYIEIDE